MFRAICRACPTNGSDCGSRCSHNLTLFVRLICVIDTFIYYAFYDESVLKSHDEHGHLTGHQTIGEWQ